jgi:nucleoside-diphosphate-sugar epimerase
MQTILGANGSIGRLLAAELKKYTSSIRLVSRNPQKVNETDELISIDLTKPGAVSRAVEGSDVVYLTLGFDYNLKVWEKEWPSLMRETIDACIKYHSKLVFFDNVYVYDQNEIPHMNEMSKVNPPSRKGLVRKEIANMLLSSAREGKLNALIARCADYYGSDTGKSLVTELILKNLYSGKSAQWFVDSSKIHSFTYAPDAARATALLGNTPDAYGQVWHLPTDDSKITVSEFIGKVAGELKVKPRTLQIPLFIIRMMGLFMPVMKELTEMIYQYDRDYFFDSSKFLKRFGIKATTYQEGIKDMCRAYSHTDQKTAA